MQSILILTVLKFKWEEFEIKFLNTENGFKVPHSLYNPPGIPHCHIGDVLCPIKATSGIHKSYCSIGKALLTLS